MNQQQFVEAQLNYAEYDPYQKFEPEIYRYTPEPGIDIHHPELTSANVRIWNARTQEKPYEINSDGFQLFEFDTSFQSYMDKQLVESEFYREVETFIKTKLDAEQVIAFDANVRSREIIEKVPFENRPLVVVHGDYTEQSAPQRVLEVASDEIRLRFAGRRYALINLWKPIYNNVQESPLALCECQSVATRDYIRTVLRYPDRDGQFFMVRANPDHRWVYFPEMTEAECLLIRCFDSNKHCDSRFVIHTAFADPSSHPEARVRESIEIRTIVFYKD